MYKALVVGMILAIAALLPTALVDDGYIHIPEMPTPKKVTTPVIEVPTPVGISAKAIPDIVVINPTASQSYLVMTKYELRVALHNTEWRGFINGSSHIEDDVWVPDDRFFKALWNIATCGKGGDFIQDVNVLHPEDHASDAYYYWRLHQTTYDTVDSIDAITSTEAVNKWCD